MTEQTKDFLIGMLLIASIGIGVYYFLTKGPYNPYSYKYAKPTQTYSLDTTQWRIPKKDTISRQAIGSVTGSYNHVIVSEFAAKEYAKQQNFTPKVYTKVWHEAATDNYIVNVIVAMTYSQSEQAEQFIAGERQYLLFSEPRFLRGAMDRSASKVLKEKKRLQKEAQQFIERQKVVGDSVEYIKNN